MKIGASNITAMYLGSTAITAAYLGGVQVFGDDDEFASLMTTLLSGASQVIAHPLDYGNMFQDRAGTTPVTEPGQQVGLVLDHGLTGKAPVPGPELASTISEVGGWTPVTNITLEQNGHKIRATASGTNARARSGAITTVPGVTYRYSGKYEIISGSDRNLRAFATSDTGTVNSLVSALGPAREFSVVFTATTTTTYIWIWLSNSDTNQVVDYSDASVRELPGYHATAISDAARGIYREVDGLKYIEYNGVNTAYKTPVLPAPGVDKAQVFAGVRKLSDAAAGATIELSTNSTTSNYSFGILELPTGETRANSSGTARVDVLWSNPSPVSRVYSALFSVEPSLVNLRIGGASVGITERSQETAGNYNPSGTYPLYYGARAGTSVFLNGHHYGTLGPIVRFGTNATEDQIAAAEAYYTMETGL